VNNASQASRCRARFRTVTVRERLLEPPSYNNQMKARVLVSLKRTVLDPQGQTVRSALTGLGFHAVSEVRQGKFFDIALDPAITRDQAHREVDTLARDVLTNPVIEEYQVEITD